MNRKTIIAIAFGLLLQWVQLGQAMVSSPAPCQTDGPAVHCECCADSPNCPCISESQPAPDAPTLPVLPETLKLPLIHPEEFTPAATPPEPTPEDGAVTSPCPHPAPVAGYRGVRLNVAFCSFVR